MINKEKLDIYNSYNGQIDRWARVESNEQKLKIETDDWFLIGALLQDIRLIERGVASYAYKVYAEKNMRENCESVELILELKKMARNRNFELLIP